MSAAMPLFSKRLNQSAGIFGLAVAVALAERLERKYIPVQIKWPNDLIVSGRKLAGLLPRLVHRGEKIRLARIGIGLNVCNKTPLEGISLNEICHPFICSPIHWSAEVLLALERALVLLEKADLVCSEAERRLWSREYKEPYSGETWGIAGLGLDGSLKIKKGYRKISLNSF